MSPETKYSVKESWDEDEEIRMRSNKDDNEKDLNSKWVQSRIELKTKQ